MWTENFFKTELFENDGATMIIYCPSLPQTQIFQSGVVWAGLPSYHPVDENRTIADRFSKLNKTIPVPEAIMFRSQWHAKCDICLTR